MKKFLFIFFIVNIKFLSANVQDDTSFAPIGAKWYNSVWCMEPPPLFYCGYYSLEIKRDTIIKGKSCRVGEYILYTTDSAEHATRIPDADLYFYTENHKVYYYANDSFLQMYDFNLHVGDTMITQMSSKCNYYAQGVSGIQGNAILSAQSIVDSIKPFYNSLQTLKGIYCHSIDLGWDSGFIGGDMWLIERMGIINKFSMFGQVTNSGILTGGYYGLLRCYEDNQISYKNPLFTGECNALHGPHVGVLNKKSQIISIYPNPSNTKLFFDGKKDMTQYQIEIFHASGQKINMNAMTIKNNSIDISNLSNGIYFGNITNGKESFSFKFVKE